MSFFVKASVHALQEIPDRQRLGRRYDIVYHGYFDIGIAVGSPRRWSCRFCATQTG